ncbi:MAG: Ig-like domain repeat protein [Terracidiphilus sp.]
MKMLVPQLSTSLFGKPATAGKALSGLAFPLITLSLALLQFAASNAAAQSTPVTPPGAIFNAGSVVPYKLLAGNMAGGFLGNGSGKDYDVAVGNGTGSGPQLFVFLGNGDGSFQAPASYTFTGTGAPSGIYLMYAGPIFSANETDLVFTDNGSKLFVLKGNGDGTFTGNTPVYLGQTAYPMKVFLNPSNNTLNIIATVGTYNSATQQTTYAVTVFVNNGSGQFTQQTVPGLGTFPVADVEYLEINSTPSLLIVGSNGTAEASTYSAGSQGTPTSVNLNLPTGSALYQVTPFEVASGFGFAAFVIQGSTTNLEAWLPGSTAGTFQSPATVANLTAYSPVQLATADINQDGYPDLVALGGGSFTTAQYILPFYGSSSGAFSAPATSPAVIGPGVYGGEMVVGNVNADAYPDIVLAQQNQGLTVLLNQANGSFPSPETYTATPPLISGTPTPDVPVGLAAADLTGTGYDDVVLANGVNTSTNPATNTDTITSFLNAGTSTSQPRFTDKGDFDTNNQPDAIALAVANSKQSAFVANEVSGNISFLQGNGDGTFQSESTISGGPLSASEYPIAIAAGTIDTSGFPGIVVGDSDNNIDVFTYSKSSGTWVFNQKYSAQVSVGGGGSPGDISSVTLYDINGDNNLDIIVTVGASGGYSATMTPQVNNGVVFIFPGKGDGTFASAIQVTSTEPSWNPGYAIGATLTGFSGPQLVVITNPICTPCQVATSQNVPEVISIFSSPTSSPVETDFPSSASGEPGPPLAGIGFFVGTNTKTPLIAVADVNADGIPDIVESKDGLIGVLPGTSSGKFASPVVQVASTDTAGLALGPIFSTLSTDAAVASTHGFVPLPALNVPASPPPATLPTPAFNPPSGPLQFGQSVTISDSVTTVPVTIYYTTNGSTPTTSSTSCTAPCTVTLTAAIGSGETLEVFGEATGYQNSADASATYTVTAVSATVNLQGSSNPAVDSPVALTATVTNGVSSSEPYSGTFAFSFKGSTISGCGAIAPNSTTGVGVCNTNALTAGSDTITATYSGDPDYSAAAPGTLTLSVAPAPVTVTLQGSSNPSVDGSITLTATVTSSVSGPTPFSGTLNFALSGSTITGCGAVAVNSTTGVATCTTNALTAGSKTITATYSGDTNYTAAAAASLVLSIAPASATVSLQSSSNPTVDSPVTLTATVTSSTSGPTPYSGVFAFSISGSTITGCGAVAANSSTGAGVCNTNALTAGSKTITATYSGDANYIVAMPATLTLSVAAAQATVTLQGPTSATVGSLVTLTATVAGSVPGPTPFSGSFNFSFSGSAISGCATVAANSTTGIATCSTSALPAGSDTITATYSGDPNYTAPTAGSLTVSEIAATAPDADYSVSTVSFPATTDNTPATQQFTLSNTGSATLTVPTIAIQTSTGGSAPEFTLNSVQCGSSTSTSNLSLAPNTNCTLTIGFSPTSATSYSAEIVFTDNASLSNITSTSTGSGNYQQIITLSGSGALPALPAPTFSPVAGNVPVGQSITISDSVTGVTPTIYYTTDGSTPTTSSTSCASPCTVTLTAASGSSETLTAIAAASGYQNSAAGSATYNIVTQSFTFTTTTSCVMSPCTSIGSSSSAENIPITVTLVLTSVNGYNTPVTISSVLGSAPANSGLQVPFAGCVDSNLNLVSPCTVTPTASGTTVYYAFYYGSASTIAKPSESGREMKIALAGFGAGILVLVFGSFVRKRRALLSVINFCGLVAIVASLGVLIGACQLLSGPSTIMSSIPSTPTPTPVSSTIVATPSSGSLSPSPITIYLNYINP